jgi:hypothetical protein
MEISLVNPRRVRLIAFLIIVAFMTIEPLYNVFFRPELGGFRDWKMFQGAAWDVIDARFVQLLDDGTEVVLDRFKLLKKTYKNMKKSARKNVKVIREKLGGEADIAKQLCEVLGPQARIKIYSRISKPQIGWVPRLEGKIVNCSEQ